jgi:hypothetical protein
MAGGNSLGRCGSTGPAVFLMTVFLASTAVTLLLSVNG